jgi:hypothetical protein
MTTDRLHVLLSEVPLPASAAACERTVAAARAEVGVPRARRPRPVVGRRLATALCAIALLAAGLLTPPGRAAAEWVGDLVGIGEVGGKPTNGPTGFQKPGTGVVIDNGTAPDGTRYEWVAYGCKVDLEDQGLPERFEGVGVSLEWPSVKGEGGGSCEEVEPGRRATVFDSYGVSIIPSQFHGVAQPDLVVSGETGRAVRRVEVVFNGSDGERRELPVDFRRIGPRLRGRLTASRHLGGTFIAFLGGDLAARDELVSRFDLRALETTGHLKVGPLGRRDRRETRAAARACAAKAPDPSSLTGREDPKVLERAVERYRRCTRAHMSPSPIEIVAYDGRGRTLGTEDQFLVIPSSAPPPVTLGNGKRPTSPDAAGKPVVLARGRAPEGARYQFFVERFERKGRVYGSCLTLWWPHDPPVISGGACGPELVPSTAFGRHHPEDVAAKVYGLISAPQPATRRLMATGYARGSVARVRVVYRDRDGAWRDARVKLTRVRGDLLARLPAHRPFGWFVSFVPRSVARAYGGIRPGDVVFGKAKGRSAIVVIAYDRAGHELSRVPY